MREGLLAEITCKQRYYQTLYGGVCNNRGVSVFVGGAFVFFLENNTLTFYIVDSILIFNFLIFNFSSWFFVEVLFVFKYYPLILIYKILYSSIWLLFFCFLIFFLDFFCKFFIGFSKSFFNLNWWYCIFLFDLYYFYFYFFLALL